MFYSVLSMLARWAFILAGRKFVLCSIALAQVWLRRVFSVPKINDFTKRQLRQEFLSGTKSCSFVRVPNTSEV